VIRLLVAGAGLRSLSEFRSSLRAERQTMLGKEGCFLKTETSLFLVVRMAALRQGSRRRAYTQWAKIRMVEAYFHVRNEQSGDSQLH